MKFLIKELFPHLKLKDKKLSITKKIYIYSNIVANIFVVVWVCLYLILPYVANQKYNYEGVTFYLYDNTVRSQQTQNYLGNVYRQMSKNGIYESKEEIEIHLLNNALIYALLNPIELLPNRQTFAITFHKKVFVRTSDIETNKTYASNGTDENLDAILMHESVHVMQNSKYGWLYTTFKMPYWVKEGYPIYSARTLSQYKEQKIIDYLIKTKDIYIGEWDAFSQDQFYGLMVKHAIEKMHKSVDDLHLGKVEYDEVLDSLLKEYNITK